MSGQRTAIAIAIALGALGGCKDCQSKTSEPDASASRLPPDPAASALLERFLDAGAPDAASWDAGPPVPFDAGASSCRLLYGPVEQPFSGPVALAVTSSTLEVVAHKNGVVKTTTFPVEPIGATKPTGQRSLGATPEKASRPPCAVAGPYAFCADANGDVHRATRAASSDPPVVVAQTEPGTRLSATELAGRPVLGFLTVRTTSEGRTSEAFAKLEGQEPVRISESGSGATELVLAARGNEVVALLIDARRAMSPVHARILTLRENKLVVGPDNVVYVGGGGDHQVHGALAVDAKGNTFGLMPISVEEGFGLVSMRIDSPPEMDALSSVSLYPNGLDHSAIAATRGLEGMYAVRVRPAERDPASPRVLEIGKLEPESGAFVSLGFIPTAGGVPYAAIEADRFGAVWIAYTDGSGTWLERRACP